jgi:hypothetical protein
MAANLTTGRAAGVGTVLALCPTPTRDEPSQSSTEPTMAPPALHTSSTLSLSLCALLTLGCEPPPGDTEDSQDPAQTSSASCICCHGCEETLKIEVEPDTGEAEGEESGDG